MLGRAMRHQRLGIFPLLDEHHLGVVGDALMQIIGNVARLFASFLDAGSGRRNEIGACLRLDGQRGNDVNH